MRASSRTAWIVGAIALAIYVASYFFVGNLR